MTTHYSAGISYIVDDTGWRVEAGCGLVLRGHAITSILDPDSMKLEEVDCERCRELYALEFLASVP